MRTFSIPALAMAILVMAVTPVFGAGFSIYEQGATATGMAGAFAAKADDATAIFYNPAGMSQLEDTTISLGLTLIPPSTEMTDPCGNVWETEDQNFWLPNFYIVHKLNDNWHVGLGVYAPYGLGMDWSGKKDFIYRHLVRDVTISAIYMTPIVSYSLSENWSIAAGAIYVKSDLEYLAAVDMT